MEGKPHSLNLVEVELVKSIYAIEPKLFGKWSYEGVECTDISLKSYVNVKSTKQ